MLQNKAQRRQPTTCSSGYVRGNPESPHGTSPAGFFVSVVVRGHPAKSGDYWYTFRYTVGYIPKSVYQFMKELAQWHEQHAP